MKIAIIGGGVSGSLLGYLLRTKTNHEVELFDVVSNYVKPCGDIVPNVFSPPYPWEVKFNIKRFAFYVDGERVYDVQYKHTKWLVIDKWKWINEMRKSLGFNHVNNFRKSEFDLVIDSKGPYDMDRDVVYTTRAIIKTDKFTDEAIFEFNTKYTGFYWVFPAEEGLLNVGAGFIEHKNSKELLLSYMKERIGHFEITDLRGAPISISPVKNKSGRIGEARGLVFPLSGEGIRPSAISAIKAFEAINYDPAHFDIKLESDLRPLEKSVMLQYKILSLYRASGLPLRKGLLKFLFKNDILIDAYLEDKLTPEGIIESARFVKSGGLLRK
ncbi:NAD(P)/FAD-dependent oxidoreductase [Stygiolobus caldivivus]|uniref:Dehydrogenase n=1 Tax=Stygiolobus caldivivus TaxID=2824673 RepID=A0A8D5U9I1_9CREN|nr:NAD(P)/FAD-dependent oxidoreductase [Stygiolobus caldivivus]BCU71211.1 dehydrogenase [Stygiolobus caldivivus]